MTKSKRLGRRQLALIDDLFKSKSDEQEILDKHKVGRQLYRKWMADDQFNEELNQRVVGAYRRSTFVLARNAGEAASKLVELACSDKGETTRKACLDILAMNPSTGAAGTGSGRDEAIEEPFPITPEAASRVLAALAKEKEISQ